MSVVVLALLVVVSIGLASSHRLEAGPAQVVAASAEPDGRGDERLRAASPADPVPLEPMPPPLASAVDRGSLSAHPDRELYESDPAGRAIAAHLEAGWVPVGLGRDRPGRGWVPAEFFHRGVPGAVSPVVDRNLVTIGYVITGIGFVDQNAFESADFDWRAYTRNKLDVDDFGPIYADEVIALIESAGGLKPVEPIPATAAP